MPTLTPEAVWAQRSNPSDASKNIVYLTFNVSNVPKESLKLNLTPTKLSYKATTDKGQEYAAEIELFEEIDPSESRHIHSARATECIIRKKEAKEEFWPRLTKEKVKLHWLKTDFDKWVDEDEQEEKAAEEPQFDPSMMSQFGGGDDAGGDFNIQTCDLGDCKELQQPFPLGATFCRKNCFVILKDCPCKINDLKVSKTGKHGFAKCNMVGYDLITGKKKQETVPGHISMFGFVPVKIEYEVADISGGQITAMTPDGQEKFFQVPESEIGTKLVAEFRENAEKGGDMFWLITVVYAPRMVGKNWQANMLVEAYKQGKAD